MSINIQILEKLMELKEFTVNLEIKDIEWGKINKNFANVADKILTEEKKIEWLEKFKNQMDAKILNIRMRLLEGKLVSINIKENFETENPENIERWGAFEWLMHLKWEKDSNLKDEPGDKNEDKKEEEKSVKYKMNKLIKEIDVLLPGYTPGADLEKHR